MFRHERVYRAVAVSSPSIKMLTDVEGFLDQKRLVAAESRLEDNGFSLAHFYYYSPKQFSPVFENLKPTERKMYTRSYRGVTEYRYNLYLVGVTLKRSFVAFIAVPFSAMAIEVVGFFRNAVRGKECKYQTVVLSRALSRIKEKRVGTIKVTGLGYKIEGDEGADELEFRGSDLILSSTVETALGRPEAPKRPQALQLQTLRFCYYRAYDARLTIETDNFGNFWFRVGRNGRNMPLLAEVLQHLDKLGLRESTFRVPYIKRDDQIDELHESK